MGLLVLLLAAGLYCFSGPKELATKENFERLGSRATRQEAGAILGPAAFQNAEGPRLGWKNRQGEEILLIVRPDGTLLQKNIMLQPPKSLWQRLRELLHLS
jgi:hypothetical protein